MKIYVVLTPEDKYMSVHKFMTDVAYKYGMSVDAIRMQFLRKGYYNKGNIKVLRVEI